MLFNSSPFFLLLLVTFSLYYLPILAKWQVGILVLASLFFYAYSEPALLTLLLASAFLNVTTSYYVAYGSAKWRKVIVTVGVSFNLAILAFYKYSPLFAKTFFNIESGIGAFLVTIPLPIGISFFTFEGISLLVDVYKGQYIDSKKTIGSSFAKHVRNTLFFISFFPHLVSGPILKAHEFFPQIGVKKWQQIDFDYCFRHIVVGYFLKMVVADNLKDFTFWIAYPHFQAQSTINLVFMLLGYSCQIFADFAGYSLIALGLAKLFGYQFNSNFNFPYIASSFKEFWKRWHISLSTFLMEYLYFPLGGNKKGKFRTYFNLLLTMVLGGLWHGAGWSYAAWGAFHGLALASERLWTDRFGSSEKKGIKLLFSRVLVFICVTIAWLFFKLPLFEHVVLYAKAITTNFWLADNSRIISYIILYSSPVWLYHAYHLYSTHALVQYIRKYRFIGYGFLLFCIIANSGSAGSFIYFQF